MQMEDEKIRQSCAGRPKRAIKGTAMRWGAFAACAALLLIAGRLITLPGKESGEEIPNPIREVADLEEAEALTGFSIAVPEGTEPYTRMDISVIGGTLLQASYRTEDDSDEGFMIRKAEGSDDISGDYNEYEQETTVTVGGREVTMKGDGDLVSVAVWNSGGYSYAVGAQDHPMSAEAMQELILAIDPQDIGEN